MLLGRFVSVGAGATAVHYLVLTLLVEGFAVGAAVAAATGAGCGLWLPTWGIAGRLSATVARCSVRCRASSPSACFAYSATPSWCCCSATSPDSTTAWPSSPRPALLLATYHLHRLWTFS